MGFRAAAIGNREKEGDFPAFGPENEVDRATKTTSDIGHAVEHLTKNLLRASQVQCGGCKQAGKLGPHRPGVELES